MTHSTKAVGDLTVSMTEFRKTLPDDQRAALDDMMLVLLKAVQQPAPIPSGGAKVLTDGKTKELMDLARKQEEAAVTNRNWVDR